MNRVISGDVDMYLLHFLNVRNELVHEAFSTRRWEEVVRDPNVVTCGGHADGKCYLENMSNADRSFYFKKWSKRFGLAIPDGIKIEDVHTASVIVEESVVWPPIGVALLKADMLSELSGLTREDCFKLMHLTKKFPESFSDKSPVVNKKGQYLLF